LDGAELAGALPLPDATCGLGAMMLRLLFCRTRCIASLQRRSRFELVDLVLVTLALETDRSMDVESAAGNRVVLMDLVSSGKPVPTPKKSWSRADALTRGSRVLPKEV